MSKRGLARQSGAGDGARAIRRNVEVKSHSGEHMDFAVKLSSQGEERTIWLPIDSKFPTEDYDALLESSDLGEAAAVELALKKLETRIRCEHLRQICLPAAYADRRPVCGS